MCAERILERLAPYRTFSRAGSTFTQICGRNWVGINLRQHLSAIVTHGLHVAARVSETAELTHAAVALRLENRVFAIRWEMEMRKARKGDILLTDLKRNR